MTDTSLEQLASHFTIGESPTLLDLEVAQSNASINIHVPAELSWFEGHFPDQPVLPGIVQIDWAGKIGKAIFADLGMFTQLSNIKFNNMILPNTLLSLELVYVSEKGILKFHFFNESGTFSTGSFVFLSC